MHNQNLNNITVTEQESKILFYNLFYSFFHLFF